MFLDHRRAVSQRRFDELHAPIYDQRWGSYLNPTHAAFVDDLARRAGAGAQVIDVACGTGKYWPRLLAAGLRVTGVDQSAGMLAVAHAKDLPVEVWQVALQDLAKTGDLAGRFDALLCVDAMECVGPEDWPRVLTGFHAVLRPGAHAYLSVELPDQEVPEPAGVLVAGEVLEDDAYHFYPQRHQVRTWLDESEMTVVKQADGHGYWHLIVRLAG
jgi:2-polyprenyl-3-methyl-5-hydroxy-6-metoxy-1,4-benzoquinol methylase